MADAAPLQVLQVFAEALWPAEPADGGLETYYEVSGGDCEAVAPGVLNTLKQRLHGMDLTLLLLLLRLLSTRLGTLVLAGRHCLQRGWPFVLSFPEMSVASRQAMFTAWIWSPLAALRMVFKVLKSVMCAVIASHVDDQGSNPFWEGMGYTPGSKRPLPAGGVRSEATAAEQLLEGALVHVPQALAAAGPQGLPGLLERRGFQLASQPAAAPPGAPGAPAEVVLECDAVVLGSGAGGGVAAAQLAAAGMRVVMVEKGAQRLMRDMTNMEMESAQTMYDNGSLIATADGTISILAGSGLGGGTKINWGASLRTPDHVRREWADKHGLPRFAPGAEFGASLDAVCERLEVHPYAVPQAGSNKVLFKAMKATGKHHKPLPCNVAGDKCDHYCVLGCRTGHKLSTDLTWLADAVKHGARILTGCSAQAVLVEGNPTGKSDSGGYHTRARRAVGVELLPCHEGAWQAAGAAGCRLVVRAPVVVSSCGTLHTPALLLRSGVDCGGSVGRHLRLHPASGVMTRFPSPAGTPPGAPGTVNMFDASMMSAFSTSCANWEGSGYGALLSTPAIHPGLATSVVPWHPGIKHDFARLGDVGVLILYTRDTGSGRVTLGAGGHPRVEYWVNERDTDNMIEALETLARGAAAAGAEEVILPHYGVPRYRKADGPASLEALVAALRRQRLPKYTSLLYSAHQMGTARMGKDPKDSVCSGEGECWDVAGLYIADASAFPTASGVNPMITTEAIAHMVAGGVARRFKQRASAAPAAGAGAEGHANGQQQHEALGAGKALGEEMQRAGSPPKEE